MKVKLFILSLCVIFFASILLGQPQWTFNAMDEDPFWMGQVDRLTNPMTETNVYVTYTEIFAIEGDGSMRLDWGVTHDGSGGGSSAVTHINLDPLGDVYDWSAYDSLVFWYYVDTPSSMPGAVEFRVALADWSDPAGTNLGIYSDMEYWYSVHDILDTASDWTKVALPLTDGFELTGWKGITGNNQLDLDAIRGYQFEFFLNSSAGDVAQGSILLDHLILLSTAGDTAVVQDLDGDPYWGGQADQYDEPETNIYLNYVSDPVFNGEAAMWLDWGAPHDQSWGGGSYLGHTHWDSLNAYDWSDYDSIAFWYYNDNPSSIPGAVHVRFNLGDVSDTSFHVTSYGDMEYWYSFHYILDDDPGWNKVALPLVDIRDDPNGNGFDRNGWYGIDGNDQLDLDVIKGFQFEFSISASEGDVAYGTIILDELVLFAGDYSSVERIPLQNPKRFQLSQNYPNPFNARTAIDYSLANTQDVLLKLFDVSGREVQTLVNGRMSAGKHTAYLDAFDFSSGVYVYKLLIGDDSQVQRMILMK
ncbi:T9SS type A sorting domain-containing protein [candidate division KSB1 bacterium]|nr:T9SS type A sorting domain-containing protein [candidate division KSB1 bacterium]